MIDATSYKNVRPYKGQADGKCWNRKVEGALQDASLSPELTLNINST